MVPFWWLQSSPQWLLSTKPNQPFHGKYWVENMPYYYNLLAVLFFSFLFRRWGFVIACLLATLSILFFVSLFAITGLAFIIQPFVQMIGGFLHPGKPMANMYFVLFSYSESPTVVCLRPPVLNLW